MTKHLRTCTLVFLVPKKKDCGNGSWKSMRTFKKMEKKYIHL
jgi:hypothetical protein